jgi:hypothetical protein
MWTDMMKLTATFCNCANAPKNHQTTFEEDVPPITNNPDINVM